VIIDLIGQTTTSTGLKVYARLDPGAYEKGVKVTDAQLAAVNIVRDEFHPDWNYEIRPTTALLNSCGPKRARARNPRSRR